jgi:hypothetical protein
MISQDKPLPGTLFPAKPNDTVSVMRSQTIVHLHNPDNETKNTTLKGLIRRLNSSLFVRSQAKAHPTIDNDPYALILLAKQEIVEGREEQAKCLVDAAYEAFDKMAKTTIARVHSTT